MKLAYLAESAIPSRAANSVHVMRMCHAFASHGHDVSLLVPDRDDVEHDAADPFDHYGIEPTFRIERLPWPAQLMRSRRYALRAGRRAAAMNPDLVYGRSLLHCASAALAGAPVVFETHAPVRGWLDRLAFRTVLQGDGMRRLVVISESLAKLIASDWPAVSHRVLVAHDGADPGPEPTASVAGDRMRVGYAGHLYAGRGIALIVALAQRCPWADFIVLGGEDADLTAWRSRAGDLGNLRFAGFVPPARVRNELDRCEVLLAPYQRRVEVAGHGGDTVAWMSPLKLFEYMAAGRPILCSDLPVLREIVEHERTAVLCAPESVDDWVAALSRLRDDPVRAGRLGRAARTLLLQRFTWSARALRVLEGI